MAWVRSAVAGASHYWLPALEGLGFAALAFVGAEAFFAPGAEGLPVVATLGPALALGFGVFGYRMLELSDERAERRHDLQTGAIDAPLGAEGALRQ